MNTETCPFCFYQSNGKLAQHLRTQHLAKGCEDKVVREEHIQRSRDQARNFTARQTMLERDLEDHVTASLGDVDGMTAEIMAAALHSTYELFAKMEIRTVPVETMEGMDARTLAMMRLKDGYEDPTATELTFKPPRSLKQVEARMGRWESAHMQKLQAEDRDEAGGSGNESPLFDADDDPQDPTYTPPEQFDLDGADGDATPLFFKCSQQYTQGTKGVLVRDGFHAMYNLEHPSCYILKEYYEECLTKMSRPDAKSQGNAMARFALFVMTDGLNWKVPEFDEKTFLKRARGKKGEGSMESQWLKWQRDLGMQIERLRSLSKNLVDFYTFLEVHIWGDDDTDEERCAARADRCRKRAARAKAIYAKRKPGYLTSIDDMLTNPDKYRDIKELMEFTKESVYKKWINVVLEFMDPGTIDSEEVKKLVKDIKFGIDCLKQGGGRKVSADPNVLRFYRFVVGLMIYIFCVRNGHRPCVVYRLKLNEFNHAKSPIRRVSAVGPDGDVRDAYVIYAADHKTDQKGVAGIVLEGTEFKICEMYQEQLRPLVSGAEAAEGQAIFLLQPNGTFYDDFKELTAPWRRWMADIYGKDDLRIFTVKAARTAISTANLTGDIVTEESNQLKVAHYLRHGIYTEKAHYRRDTVEETCREHALVSKLVWQGSEPLSAQPEPGQAMLA